MRICMGGKIGEVRGSGKCAFAQMGDMGMGADACSARPREVSWAKGSKPAQSWHKSRVLGLEMVLANRRARAMCAGAHLCKFWIVARMRTVCARVHLIVPLA